MGHLLMHIVWSSKKKSRQVIIDSDDSMPKPLTRTTKKETKKDLQEQSELEIDNNDDSKNDLPVSDSSWCFVMYGC